MLADGEEYLFRVLFAGDSPDLFGRVETILREMKGARMDIAHCETQSLALDALSNGTFDICLTARSLRDGTGLDFIRSAATVSWKVPVIFLGEESDRKETAEAMEAGAADCLQKEEITLPLLERSFRYVLERRHLQEEMGMLLSAADEAVNAKNRFMANITHEIKTPLNAIIGMIDLVLDSDLTHKQHENLMLARFSADSLLGLATNIIDCSSLETGNLVLKSRVFSLRQVVGKAVLPFTVSAERKKIRLTTFVSEDVPDEIYGDPERFVQVVGNLLNNAVKFTEQGEVSVSVTLKEAYESGIVLHCTIADTGVGIPREKINKAFQSFIQMDGSSTRKYGGAGLGLAIARNLVTMMGGRIWAESEPAKGSVFHFTAMFGWSQKERELPGQTIVAVTGNGDHPSCEGAVRVLVAEDSVVNQIVLTEILQKAGYEVTVTGDGRKAVEAVRRHSYSAVFMDLQMPVMDGWVAARIIREREAVTGGHLPIIALSGSEYCQDRERCRQAGMDEYITKPFDEEELLDVLAKYLPSRRKPSAGALFESLRRHLEVDGVLANLGGNEQLLSEVVNYFMEEGPAQLQNVRAGLRTGDERLVEQSAHKLKGMAANIGAMKMADEVLRIQLAVRKGDMKLAAELSDNVAGMLASLAADLQ